MVAISPTRLRMKLLGSNHKDDPTRKTLQASRLDDDDHPNNSLLPQELDEGACVARTPWHSIPSSWHRPATATTPRCSVSEVSDSIGCPAEYPKDHRSDSSRSRSDASHDRISGSDDDSGTNFEFCKDERAALPASAAPGPFFRQQVPSKWNDAEKWIAGRHHRHVVHSNPVFSKKPAAGAPTELSSNRSSHKKPRFSPAAVSTRDVGTEMTPAASQEQSRSGTPAGAATPALSPLCSAPSSPRRGGSSSVPERELRLRTRREIAALGLQLGKMSIASWASNEEGLLAAASPEKDKRAGAVDAVVRSKAFEARAAAWEESNKCKLAARCAKKRFFFEKNPFKSLLLLVTYHVHAWCPQIPEEGGEDRGMGKLAEMQIRSQAEAGRGLFFFFFQSLNILCERSAILN
jgi:hypothetical protein